MPTPLAPCLDEDGLAGLEATELEQAVTGCPEWNRDARRLLGRHPLRDDPAKRLAHRSELGM